VVSLELVAVGGEDKESVFEGRALDLKRVKGLVEREEFTKSGFGFGAGDDCEVGSKFGTRDAGNS
jgi:hypothetical protein